MTKGLTHGHRHRYRRPPTNSLRNLSFLITCLYHLSFFMTELISHPAVTSPSLLLFSPEVGFSSDVAVIPCGTSSSAGALHARILNNLEKELYGDSTASVEEVPHLAKLSNSGLHFVQAVAPA